MGTDKGILFQIGNRRYEVTLLGLLTFFFFCRLSFLNFAKTFHLPFNLVVYSIVLILIGTFVLYTFRSPKNISWDGIVLIGAMAVFFAATLYFHPEYQDRFNDAPHNGRFSAEAVFQIGSAIYAYYVIRLHRFDAKKLYDIFKCIAWFLLFLNIWTIAFNREDAYSMDFGYQMAMAAILFMAVFLYEKKKLLYLFLSGGSIAAGVVYGSRACVIGYAVFIAAYMIWQHRMTLRQFFLLFLGLLAVLVYNSRTIMMGIYNLLVSMGLNSRTLRLIAEGDIMAADTARQDSIWPDMIARLKSASVFKIRGAYGGRYLLDTKWAYEHNIILELFMTFGIVLGTLFLIWMIVRFLQALHYDKDHAGLLTLAFGCFSICRLMLSNTFWQEAYFWAFLAMLVNCAGMIRRRKRAEREKNRALYSAACGSAGGMADAGPVVPEKSEKVLL